uniref:Uncharacterized protein n=1 Tax=Aegilops tauschii TaxID=37682 RepID=M8BBE2_AEGTA
MGSPGDSSSDAAAASPSAVAADASSTLSPPLPPAAPLERPQEERDREQAGGSAAAAGVDREGRGSTPQLLLRRLLPRAPRGAAPRTATPRPPEPGRPENGDAAASGAGPFDCRLAFQQMLQEQTAIKEAGGPLAEGAGKKKKPEEAQVMARISLLRHSVVSWGSWKSLKCVLERFLVSVEQVKSSHAIGELWNNLRKFFHGESPGYVHYSQHVNHQTHPITEVRKYYLVSDLATGQGVDHLDAYSKFRPVTGDGECFYRSFIFSYLEQVLDGQDTHEEHRLLDALKRVSVQHADLRWTSEFPRSYRLPQRETSRVLQKLRYDGRQLVVAIWICSHAKQYEPRIPGLDRRYSLKDWCFQHVTPSRQYADHVMMTALAEALEVPLRVEQLNGGPAQDIYTVPGPGVPRVSVTLLYTGNHYDVLYPHAPPTESSSQQTS